MKSGQGKYVKMKLTVYIDNVFHEEEEVTDPKEIAKVVRNHITHLGKVKVYYRTPLDDMTWWEKLLFYMSGGL